MYAFIYLTKDGDIWCVNMPVISDTGRISFKDKMVVCRIYRREKTEDDLM